MGKLDGASDYFAQGKRAAAASAMRTELWKAKVALCEARHQARVAGHGLVERIDAMFNDADRLFCDARSEEDKRRAEFEALLDAEYGPTLGTTS